MRRWSRVFRPMDFELPGFAAAYMQTILEHDWIAAWMESAEERTLGDRAIRYAGNRQKLNASMTGKKRS